MKNAGILGVFQVFQAEKLGQKIGHPNKKEFLEVPEYIEVIFEVHEAMMRIAIEKFNSP